MEIGGTIRIRILLKQSYLLLNDDSGALRKGELKNEGRSHDVDENEGN